MEALERIGEMYNFTASVFLEPSGEWGVSGVSTINASVGVMGQTLSGASDVALAAWFCSLQRATFFDCPFALYAPPFRMVTNVNKRPTDFALYTRPFRLAAWVAVVLMALAATLVLNSFGQAKKSRGE